MDKFFQRLPRTFKLLILNEFFGLSPNDNISFFFEIDSFFDTLTYSTNLSIPKIFDANFLLCLTEQRSGNNFFSFLKRTSINLNDFTRDQFLLILRSFIIDQFKHLVFVDFFKDRLPTFNVLSFLRENFQLFNGFNKFNFSYIKPKSLYFFNCFNNIIANYNFTDVFLNYNSLKNYYNLKRFDFIFGEKEFFFNYAFSFDFIYNALFSKRVNKFLDNGLYNNLKKYFLKKIFIKDLEPLFFFKPFDLLMEDDLLFDESLSFSSVNFNFSKINKYTTPFTELKLNQFNNLIFFDQEIFNFKPMYQSMAASMEKNNLLEFRNLFKSQFYITLNHNFFIKASPFFLNKDFFFFNRSYSIFKNYSKMFLQYFIFANSTFSKKPSFEQILLFFSKFPKNNYVLSKDLNGNIIVHTFGLSSFFDFNSLTSCNKFNFSFGKFFKSKNFYSSDSFFFGFFDKFNFSYYDYLNSFFSISKFSSFC